jgi:hypothetical protein
MACYLKIKHVDNFTFSPNLPTYLFPVTPTYIPDHFVSNKICIIEYNRAIRRSQWSLRLIREMFTTAQKLGSWVRIPLTSWMHVCFFSILALSCVGRDLATGRTPSKELYQMSINKIPKPIKWDSLDSTGLSYHTRI